MAESRLKLEETDEEGITYTYLPTELWYWLDPIFAQYNTKPPNPSLTRVAVAIHNDKLIGIYCLQLLPHAEPMWIAPEYKGTKIWLKLAAMIDGNRKGHKTYIVAETDESERMCMALGLKRIEYPVFIKED